MSAILSRVVASGDFEVVMFGDAVILNKNVEEWPTCDCLISFFSKGFPLDKAEKYVALRRPFLINQLGLQRLLLDRRKVYKVLQEHNIPVPPHIIINRSSTSTETPTPTTTTTTPTTPPPPPPTTTITPTTSQDSQDSVTITAAAAELSKSQDDDDSNSNLNNLQGSTSSSQDMSFDTTQDDEQEPPALALSEPGESFEEEEDAIVFNGRKLYKPFVEKPVSGEDHNVCIYYPAAMGGGMKGLFRKKADRSAEFHPEISTVRRDGSYIYEAFLPTGGTDVKVYTVGPNYAHAEARKSPVVDGRVLRDDDGKEVRYPVLLSMEEKRIAREVCMAFGQMVCGFDLLRSKGRTYVCDVNGWSFVKNSEKYYDDTREYG